MCGDATGDGEMRIKLVCFETLETMEILGGSYLMGGDLDAEGGEIVGP